MQETGGTYAVSNSRIERLDLHNSTLSLLGNSNLSGNLNVLNANLTIIGTLAGVNANMGNVHAREFNSTNVNASEV